MLEFLDNIQNYEIILIILLYILSNEEDKINEFNKEDKNYNIVKTLQKYKNILYKFNNNNIKLKNNYLINLLNDFEYFYIFKSNKFPLVYFFKMDDTDIIYFIGITFGDKNFIKIFINIILKKFNEKYMNELIEEKGFLYILYSNNIEKTNQFSLLESFDFIYNKHYYNNENKIINIIGYSLGGIISQFFSSILVNNNKYNIEIHLNNIETWFMGNNEEFEIFVNKIKKINNIYNENSPFKIYNNYFQPYFKSNFIIKNKNKNIINKTIDHLLIPSPLRLIDYILKNHSLNNIIK